MKKLWTNPAFRLGVFLGTPLLLGYGVVLVTDNARERELAVARAVTVLPPGAEEEWLTFIDRRITETIRRAGDEVQVAGPNFSLVRQNGKATMLQGGIGATVAYTTPYKVSCLDMYFGSVEFAGFGTSVSATIFGEPYYSLTPTPMETKEKEPSLGVDEASVAAKQLSEKLCARISARMAELTAPASTGADQFAAAKAADARHDYATAFKLLRPLAEQGNAEAQSKLGDMYRIGGGMPQNDAEAFRWYSQAATNYRKAAEQGDAAAQSKLGVMYANGLGLPRDDAAAEKWYRKAAAQGDGTAQLMLAYTYSKNDAEAVMWYREAAEGGDVDAQLALGLMYREGQRVPQNDPEAFHWFRKSAEQGNAAAQFNLGEMYRDGRGTPRDNIQAYMWMTLAFADRNRGRVTGAAEMRKIIEHSMTPLQIAEGQRLADEWRPTGAREQQPVSSQAKTKQEPAQPPQRRPNESIEEFARRTRCGQTQPAVRRAATKQESAPTQHLPGESIEAFMERTRCN